MKYTLLLVACCMTVSNLLGDSELVAVKGTGVGETEVLALKDAYRDAVETAVGMFVDAEQAVKDDKVIEDQILTQSNAYIENYDIIEKKQTSAGVKIKISAKVKKQALTKRMSGLMKPNTVSLGDSLKQYHAASTTEKNRDEDGAALLSNALKGIDPIAQLYDMTLVSTAGVPVEKSSDSESLEIDYLFRLRVNSERYYNEFLPNLDRVLTQISLEKPQEIRFNVKKGSMTSGRGEKDAEAYATPGKLWGMDARLSFGMFRDNFMLNSAVLGDWRGQASLCVAQEFKKLPVVLITKANESLTLVKGKLYSLDSKSAAVLLAWRDGANTAARRRNVPRYDVSFVDGSGEELAAQTVSPQGAYDTLSCENIVCFFGRNDNPNVWFVSPFVGCSAKEYLQWYRFKLAKDDLPKIKSLKVEVAQ